MGFQLTYVNQNTLIMKENVVMEKSYGFAIRIVNLYRVLRKRDEFVLSKQLIRSGTAIGALIAEAEHAQSKADFVSKINIALKEANESKYWIKLLKDTGYITHEEFTSISTDCYELIKLTASIIKTSKNEK